MSEGKTGAGEFPHAPLTPFEATPRITPEDAKRICDLIDALRDADPSCTFCAKPAICVAVWVGPLVKWLVNGVEAQETIRRLEKGLEKLD